MAVERAKRQVVLDFVLPDLNPVALQQLASGWTSSLNRFGTCWLLILWIVFREPLVWNTDRLSFCLILRC